MKWDLTCDPVLHFVTVTKLCILTIAVLALVCFGLTEYTLKTMDSTVIDSTQLANLVSRGTAKAIIFIVVFTDMFTNIVVIITGVNAVKTSKISEYKTHSAVLLGSCVTTLVIVVFSLPYVVSFAIKSIAYLVARYATLLIYYALVYDYLSDVEAQSCKDRLILRLNRLAGFERRE
uniref:Uncharacterized protein n=1 Tax=Euplotes harpa TaxID=151035 RepID=A0A7S3N9E9_9SPIT|mmetsp:Transcript_26116/g.30157  ORF Transcript_26116/g.30157 Transcript_26116/m.30157 type:complete len:176 (+) Transcript_26116:274-801(+)